VILLRSKAQSIVALTGITSLPIPSAGIKPILSVFLAAVVRGRNAMADRVRLQLPHTSCRKSRVTRVNYDNVTVH
jgi:hypothetical protein